MEEEELTRLAYTLRNDMMAQAERETRELCEAVKDGADPKTAICAAYLMGMRDANEARDKVASMLEAASNPKQ